MNALEEAKKTMQNLLDQKARQAEEIRAKLTAAAQEQHEANIAMEEAAARLDLRAYAEARTRGEKAAPVLEMYRTRERQLQNQEIITEAESDEVIASLLQYEKDLQADFVKAAAEPLRKLEALRRDYLAALDDTVNTIAAWTSNIHANYRRPGSRFADTGTDRASTPQPVHPIPVQPAGLALDIQDFVARAKSRGDL